jgi:hypothetical protein
MTSLLQCVAIAKANTERGSQFVFLGGQGCIANELTNRLICFHLCRHHRTPNELVRVQWGDPILANLALFPPELKIVSLEDAVEFLMQFYFCQFLPARIPAIYLSAFFLINNKF